MTTQEVSDKLDSYDKELLKLEIQTLKLEIKRGKVILENIGNKDFLNLAKQKADNHNLEEDAEVIELIELQKQYQDLYHDIYKSKSLSDFINND